MDKIVITKSSKETQKLGEDFVLRSRISLRETKGSIIIALFGNLGSGKTTFSQGFAKGLGIKERIISPTFIIIREYQISNIKFPISNFYHVDLYRTETKEDIEGLGLSEIFSNQKNIIVVEWAEKIKDLLPKERIEIYFEHLEKNQRKITFKNYE